MSYTRFEWDEAKNRRNTRKHGLSFSTAASMFEHPHLVRLDTRQEYGEDRWIAVGLIGPVVCVVVYSDRLDEHGTRTIRIISARKATRHEREEFEKKIGN
jgi:uncharacterized DUF497 family protein